VVVTAVLAAAGVGNRELMLRVNADT